MIKTLQRKFVVTAMIAVSVLLLILLGTINAVNISIVKNETGKTLDMISRSEGNFNRVPMDDKPAPPPDFKVEPKGEGDKLLSSNYFVVRLNQNGTVISADVSRTSTVGEDDAKKTALEVFSAGEEAGKEGKYRYKISHSIRGDVVIVFLDTSEEILSYIRVLLLSAAVGIVCWGLMLLMVIFLSRKAISPIAENMSKQKQFITNAGHEIKTPLAIIMANADAMELYNGQNKWTQNIKEQTVRLNGLMQNMLLMAKMDEGSAEGKGEAASETTGKMAKTETDISLLVNQSIQSFTEPMNLRKISLQADIQPDIMIKANGEQIMQLLSILFDNALKYTDGGGNVWVSLKKYEKHVKLEMKNSCEKLPNSPPDKLFDRFFRDDEARTQKTGGYGIGLSVAKSIVEANKGSITAEYEDPDIVSFKVRL